MGTEIAPAQRSLESSMGASLVGARLVVGREYQTGHKDLKLKYLGVRDSGYDRVSCHQHEFRRVHRFILGRFEGDRAMEIAQVDILEENLQVSPEGMITRNNETLYPTRHYFPAPTKMEGQGSRTFNRLVKFARYNSFLMEESR